MHGVYSDLLSDLASLEEGDGEGEDGGGVGDGVGGGDGQILEGDGMPS